MKNPIFAALLIVTTGSTVCHSADSAIQPAQSTRSETTDYSGRWIEGSGDKAVLEAVDAAFESTQPSARMACLPLLYKRNWDGFVEGPPWPCWWIQNSFGPSYGLMPILGEPQATWLEHSQSLWFRLMGDGNRKDVNGFQGPNGCLCDAAFVMMNGGSKNGFGDFRRPGGGVEQTVDGSIHQEGVWYRQGDGNPKQHDWFIGTTAAGLILESDRLLVRHDVAAARKRLPQLERVAAFLDSNYQYLYADLEGDIASFAWQRPGSSRAASGDVHGGGCRWPVTVPLYC